MPWTKAEGQNNSKQLGLEDEKQEWRQVREREQPATKNPYANAKQNAENNWACKQTKEERKQARVLEIPKAKRMVTKQQPTWWHGSLRGEEWNQASEVLQFPKQYAETQSSSKHLSLEAKENEWTNKLKRDAYHGEEVLEQNSRKQ